jgi:hypothetical protein
MMPGPLYSAGGFVFPLKLKKDVSVWRMQKGSKRGQGNYKLLPCGRGANEFNIIEIPRSVPCASCTTKSSNKQCKHSCCKKCCLDKYAQGQEACCNAHTKVIVAATPATAGTSSNPQDSSFEDGSQSSLVCANSDEDDNEDDNT